MRGYRFFSISEVVLLSALVLLSGSAFAAATNASLKGTYTFQLGALGNYNVEFNMFGQQVGFCPISGGPLPYGYYCSGYLHYAQEVITGTLVADGNGNIVSSSNFVFTTDPNEYQCSSKYNEAPDCPYQVPSGIPWSSSTSYVVGDEVDFGGQTFQAVQNNTGVSPNGNTCTAMIQPPNCTWDQLYQSADGKNGSGSGSVSGTYMVQANGSGVLQLTFTAGTKNNMATFVIVLPAKSALGQEVQLVALPQLGQGIQASGTAVRVK